ncbi:MAG: PilZ domain-containing protein [Candidatus Omnitrophota bacterium]|jgi:c-di-GMP-binding flagellar brake protein YcgR
MDNTYKGPERRKSPRVKVDFFVVYKVDRPTESNMWIDDKEVKARMIDLSEIGMAILTNCDIPALTILSLKFTLMNLYTDKVERVKTIEIIGEVRYNKLLAKDEYRLGISFVQIAEEDKQAIAEFKKMAMGQ